MTSDIFENDKITTRPFGHHVLREEMFMRNLIQDPDWGSSDEEVTVVHVAESLTPENQPPTQYTGPPMSAEVWSPPDPGLNQRVYSDDELEADIADFANLTQQVIDDENERCSFIDDQVRRLVFLTQYRIPPFMFLLTLQHKSNPSTIPDPQSMKKCTKRTLELISDKESINVGRIKKWRVVQIDSDSDDN